MPHPTRLWYFCGTSIEIGIIMASPLAQAYTQIKVWVQIRLGLGTPMNYPHRPLLLTVLLQCAAAACGITMISGIVLALWYEPSSRPVTDMNGTMQALAYAHTLSIGAHGDTLALPGEALMVPLSSDRQPLFFDSALARHCTIVRNHQGIPIRLHAAAASVEITLTNHHPTGAWLRAVHMWSVHLLMFSLLGAAFTMIIQSSWRAPNEFLWLTIVAILFVSAVAAWTGSLLPWTVFSVISAQIVGTFIHDYVPFVGDTVSNLFLQGDTVSDHTLPRIFSLHTLILPITLIMLWRFIHILCQRLHYPLFRTLTWSFTISIVPISVMLIAYYLSPLRMGPSFLPADTSLPITALPDTKPAWYFLPFFTLLRALPADAVMLILLMLSMCTVCMPGLDKRIPSWLLHTATIATILIFVWLGIRGFIQ